MAVHIQVINQVRAKINNHGKILWGKVVSIAANTLEVSLEGSVLIRSYTIRERLGSYETKKDNSIMEYRCTLEGVREE